MEGRCIAVLSCCVEERADESGDNTSVATAFGLSVFGDVRDPCDDLELLDTPIETAEALGMLASSLGDNEFPVVAVCGLARTFYPLEKALENLFTLEVMARNQADMMTADAMDGKGRKLFRLWDCNDYCDYEYPDGSIESFEKCASSVVGGLQSTLDANGLYLYPSDFGTSAITKTSLVRLYAKRILGSLRYVNAHGAKMTVKNAYDRTCRQQFWKSCEEYRYAKACFAGGLTFVSADNACKVLEGVKCADVVSMHHAFINGRFFPVHFTKANMFVANTQAVRITSLSIDDVLSSYHDPISYYINAAVRFIGLRLKAGSVFERFHIGLVSQANFSDRISDVSEYGVNDRARLVDEDLRLHGFRCSGTGLQFAFGKLMAADDVTVFCDENELWNMSRVYEWDYMEVMGGYDSAKRIRPPDYVTLQSNMLYDKKREAKERAKSDASFADYYISNVKSMFNSIYGTQVQDVMKPDFAIEGDSLEVDASQVPTEYNFDELKPSNPNTLFNMGSRVSSAARMHLVIALETLYKGFSDEASIISGDTDSIYIQTSHSAFEIEECLEPLHRAAQEAISFTLRRCREEFPMQCADLSDVGAFKVDSEEEKHYEFACKTRAVQMGDGSVKVVAAGIPKLDGSSDYEGFVKRFAAEYGFDKTIPLCMGFNTYINKAISKAATVFIPKFGTETDGLPRTLHYEDESMTVGSDFKCEYRHSIMYMVGFLKRDDIDIGDTGLEQINGISRIIHKAENGTITVLESYDKETQCSSLQ